MVHIVCTSKQEAHAQMQQQEKEQAEVVKRAAAIKATCKHRVSVVEDGEAVCAVCDCAVLFRAEDDAIPF